MNIIFVHSVLEYKLKTWLLQLPFINQMLRLYVHNLLRGFKRFLPTHCSILTKRHDSFSFPKLIHFILLRMLMTFTVCVIWLFRFLIETLCSQINLFQGSDKPSLLVGKILFIPLPLAWGHDSFKLQVIVFATSIYPLYTYFWKNEFLLSTYGG